MSPWNLTASSPDQSSTQVLYPDYATTAAILEEMGLPEDFQCQPSGLVRHTHRQTDSEDIYFVANALPETLEVPPEQLKTIRGIAEALHVYLNGVAVPVPEVTVHTPMLIHG